MSLRNLLAIRRLQTHTPDRNGVLRLLQAARRNLLDARVAAISEDNRFDAAYKCIMQCAMLGLWANGYRTSTSQPGHHQTAIQCLGLTLGVPQSDLIVLDALRRQRNVSDYEGDPVPQAVLASCVARLTSCSRMSSDGCTPIIPNGSTAHEHADEQADGRSGMSRHARREIATCPWVST